MDSFSVKKGVRVEKGEEGGSNFFYFDSDCSGGPRLATQDRTVLCGVTLNSKNLVAKNGILSTVAQ